MTQPSHRIDHGNALHAIEPDADRGVAVYTQVCPSSSCTAMHLHCVPVTRVPATDGDSGMLELAPKEAFNVSWCGETSTLDSKVDAELEAWLERHVDLLRERWRRLQLKRHDHLYALRSAPQWRPGSKVSYDELYPGAFTPYVIWRGERWALIDDYCPDPACTCQTTVLWALGPEDAEETLRGQLGRSQPGRDVSRRGQQLWQAIHDDRELMAQLTQRRARFMEASAFIVGEHYEASRLRHQPSGKATSEVNEYGFLQGNDSLEPWVARLLAAARVVVPHLPHLHPDPMRVVVPGGALEVAWFESTPEELRFYRGPGDEQRPWLVVYLYERAELPSEFRRQRAVYGWPSLGDGRVPVLAAFDDAPTYEDAFHPPTRDELRFAMAALEAIAEHCLELVEEDDHVRTLKSDVDIDGVAVEVELMAAADVPAPKEGGHERGQSPGESNAAQRDEARDAEHPSSAASLRPMLDAFRDWCIGGHIPQQRASLGERFANELRDFSESSTGSPTAWLDAPVVRDFLLVYAPRQMTLRDEEEIDDALPALGVLVDWLEQVSHLDAAEAARLRRAIERAAPKFATAMRDRSRFGPAKELYSDMLSEGVDIWDQDAVAAYIARTNAAVGSLPAKARPRSHGSRPDRWRPEEGEAPPDLKAPCPCGSGRRYKKCCRPR